MIFSRWVALASIVACIAGCGSPLGALQRAADGIGEIFAGKDSAEPPKELSEDEPTELRITELWDGDSGNGSNEQFVNLVPAVSEDAVFTIDVDGHLERRARLTGERLFETETGLQVASGPVYTEGKLLIGTRNGEVCALQESDGSLAWKAVLSSELIALAQVSDDTVVVRTQDGKIAGFALDSGATRWIYERSVPALELRSRHSPMIAGDLVIDGFMSGKVVALGLRDGKVQWETNVTIPHGRSEVERLIDLAGVAVPRDDIVYLTGYNAGITAISLRDGEIVWRRDELSTANGLAASRRALFATDVASDAWRYEMSNGAALWKQEELHQRRLTAPALYKDYVVVGDFEGYVHFISQEDGRLMARYRLDKKPLEAEPVVFDEVIYVLSSAGKIAALTAE